MGMQTKFLEWLYRNRLLLVTGLLIGAVVSAYAAPVQAQAVCGKRTDIIQQLEAKYGETRRAAGVQQGRGVLEVYASAKTGSWTILITNARGLSCLMAAGEAFEVFDVQAEEGEKS